MPPPPLSSYHVNALKAARATLFSSASSVSRNDVNCVILNDGISLTAVAEVNATSPDANHSTSRSLGLSSVRSESRLEQLTKSGPHSPGIFPTQAPPRHPRTSRDIFVTAAKKQLLSGNQMF